MVDHVSAAKRSEIMRAVPTKSTSPELALRKVLDDLKIPYKVNVAELPGRPDILIASKNLVLFVHGCFWHGHSNCRKAKTPKSNVEFWEAKFARNRRRDGMTSARLRRLGYSVYKIWACQINKGTLPTRLLSRLNAR